MLSHLTEIINSGKKSLMDRSDSKPGAIPSLPGKSKPYVLAHRGNKILCPENTLAAFRQALADGADIIETDLHISADGVFICIHDDTVERTTDGSGPVEAMTLAELKQLKAHDGRPEFGNEKIPTLAELIEILPDNVALALELKSDRFLERDICVQLVQELKAAGIFERTMVLSFSLSRIQAVRAVEPSIRIGWITLSKTVPIPNVDVLGPYWPILLLNPLYVKIAHSRNQAVCPLDSNPDSRLWLYKMLGCDAVLTDNPQVTCRKLRRQV